MSSESVAVIAFDGISPFHLSVPCVVFGEDRRADGIPCYDVRICAAGRSRRVTTTAGFSVTADYDLQPLQTAGTVIVPSWRSTEDAPPAALLEALRSAHARGARIVGLCLGTFALAATGLLDGRRATTHWRYASVLSERYPMVRVEPDRLWVDLDDVITSAGTAAALDCCLHLVRRDHGADIANRLARRLVIAPHRSGDQSQFIERPVPPTDIPDEVATTMVWARQHLDQPITLEHLAAHASMSRRTFTRHFRAATGTSPHQWLLHERLGVAQSLLETGGLSIDLVAERSGLGSAATLRQHYQRRFGTSPRAYRDTFTISG